MAIITLRGVDDETAETLKEKAGEEGMGVNSFLLRLVRNSLKIGKRKRTTVHHDLDSLAGTWNKKDLAEFRRNTAEFERIDEELWNEPRNSYSVKRKRAGKK